MIETDARVVAVEEGKAWVEANRRSSCGHCDAAGSCGGAIFGELFGNRAVRVEVENGIDAAVGQQVVVGLPEGAMLSGALRLYLLPLLGLFFGVLLGQSLAGRFFPFGEPGAILGGLMGLLIALLLMNRVNVGKGRGQQPVILRKVAGQAVVGFHPPSLDEERI